MGWSDLRSYAREQWAGDPRFPPSWRPDPWGVADLRWWDGETWSEHVSSGGEVWVSEPPPRPDAEAVATRPGPPTAPAQLPPTLGPPALRWAVLAYVGGFVAVVALVVPTVWLLGHGIVPGLVSVVALYGPMLLACRHVSRTVGTGSWAEDLGLRARWTDVLRGWGAYVLAGFLGGIVVLVLARSPRLRGTNTQVLYNRHLDGAALAFVAVTAILVAPIVEELFFRGLLLRALTDRVRPAIANCLQAALFTIAHFQVTEGLHNTEVLLRIAVVGVIFGRYALKHRRLGPTIAAHMTMNTIAVAYAFAHR